MNRSPFRVCRCVVQPLTWCFALLAAATCFGADTIEARRDAMLAQFAERPLKQEFNPDTWVDVERWSVAHAAMATNVRLDEANQYFANVQWVSLYQGLVADTDVQITDLIRTYFEFRDDKRLSLEAKAHLEKMMREWVVPNQDRNRRADLAYEWPYTYTENHSLNILAAAYLIDTALDRDRALRKDLLERFLHDRARWGWSEFHSPQYAMTTAKCLTTLVDFAPDESVSTGARILLDLLAIEFATHSLNHWRGMPFVRGAGRENDNSNNSFLGLARFWFGDRTGNTTYDAGDPFLVHALRSSYRPPAAAQWLYDNPHKRGTYEWYQTATTGVERLRVPIVVWVTPHVTMASAQGFGHYYAGNYCSISFASSPKNVITVRYGNGRNILQRGNVLAAFGEVKWHGELTRESTGPITVGGDGKVMVGQIDLGDGAHVIMTADPGAYANGDAFRAALQKLDAKFENGVVSWTASDGKKIRMVNRREGEKWRMVEATEDDALIRLDRNMLFQNPHMQSVYGSGLVEVVLNGRKEIYDYRDPTKPITRRESAAKFTPLPPERVEGPIGVELIYVPPGAFPMGAPADEGRNDEQPQRWVQVDGFYIGKLEVTVGQYKQFLAENPGVAPPPEWFYSAWGKTEQYPMTWVTRGEAEAFCAWLSKKSGKTFRLPTEAEWERAAKGFSHRVYPWGDTYDGTQSGTPNGEYAPAGAHTLDVSYFGVRDMAGNAWEWCADDYAADAYRTQPDANPKVDINGGESVLRGCGWNFDPATFRASYRTSLPPDQRSVHIGFRVVREP